MGCGIRAKATIESDANIFRFYRHPTCQPYEVANSILVDFMTSRYKIVDYVRLNVAASGALLEVHVFDDLQAVFSFTFGMFGLVDGNGGISSEFLAQVKRTAGPAHIFYKFLGDLKKHLVGQELLDDFDLKMDFDTDTESDIPAWSGEMGPFGGEELSTMDELSDFDMNFLPISSSEEGEGDAIECKITLLGQQVMMDQSRTSMIEGARTLAEIDSATLSTMPEHLQKESVKIISTLLESSVPAVLYPTAVFLADSPQGNDNLKLPRRSKERIAQLATDKEMGSILRSTLRQAEEKVA